MSFSDVPERFRLAYDDKKIAAAVERLGDEIGKWAAEVREKTQQDVICVPIMRGGMFFASDLTRALGTSVEIAPVTTSSYSSSTNNAPHLNVKIDLSALDVKGRAILAIDDICDSGRTLAVLSEKFALSGVAEFKSVVLIQRKLDNIIYEPSYVGFNYDGEEWFVGYGMEDSARFRNLPSVYTIKPGA